MMTHVTVMLIVLAFIALIGALYSLLLCKRSRDSRKDFWVIDNLSMDKRMLPAGRAFAKPLYEGITEKNYDIYSNIAFASRQKLIELEQLGLRSLMNFSVYLRDDAAELSYADLLWSPFVTNGEIDGDKVLDAMLEKVGEQKITTSNYHESLSYMQQLLTLVQDLDKDAHIVTPVISAETQSERFREHLKVYKSVTDGINSKDVQRFIATSANVVTDTSDLRILKGQTLVLDSIRKLAKDHFVLQSHNEVGICAENALSLQLLLQAAGNGQCYAALMSAADVLLDRIERFLDGNENQFVKLIIDVERLIVLNFAEKEEHDSYRPGALIKWMKELFPIAISQTTLHYKTPSSLSYQLNAYVNGINVIVLALSLLRSFVSIPLQFIYPRTLMASAVPQLGIIVDGKLKVTMNVPRNYMKLWEDYSKNEANGSGLFSIKNFNIGSMQPVNDLFSFSGTLVSDIGYNVFLNVFCWRNTECLSLDIETPMDGYNNKFSITSSSIRLDVYQPDKGARGCQIMINSDQTKNTVSEQQVQMLQRDIILVNVPNHTTLFINNHITGDGIVIPAMNAMDVMDARLGKDFATLYPQCRNRSCYQEYGNTVTNQIDQTQQQQQQQQQHSVTEKQKMTLTILYYSDSKYFHAYLNLIGVKLLHPLFFADLIVPGSGPRMKQLDEILYGLLIGKKPPFGSTSYRSSFWDDQTELEYPWSNNDAQFYRSALNAVDYYGIRKNKEKGIISAFIDSTILDTDTVLTQQSIEQTAIHYAKEPQYQYLQVLLPLLRLYRFEREQQDQNGTYTLWLYQKEYFGRTSRPLKTTRDIVDKLQLQNALQDETKTKEYQETLRQFANYPNQNMHYTAMSALAAALDGIIPQREKDRSDEDFSAVTLSKFVEEKQLNIDQINKYLLDDQPLKLDSLWEIVLKQIKQTVSESSDQDQKALRTQITQRLVACAVLIYYDDHSVSEFPFRRKCQRLVADVLAERQNCYNNLWDFFGIALL